MLSNSFRRLHLFTLGIVLLTILTRLPSLLHPLPIDDEETYSLVGNAIVDGGHVYTDAVERKPPLLFWMYAGVFKAAGEYNWKALHTVALIWTLATMAGLFLIGKRLFDPFTGLVAALLYSVFQPWATSMNLAFNGEVIMNLPLVWAWAIALGRSRSRIRPELLVAGALLGTGFLFKQPAAIAAVPIGIYLLLPSYRASRRLTSTDSIVHATLLTIGFFAALGLAAMVLWRQGTLAEAYYWIFTENSVPYIFWLRGLLFTLAFAGACLPLLLGATAAYRDADGIWRGKSAERTALLGLLVASALGAAAGARFYPHYYIQLIPPLALLAAASYARLWSGQASPIRWWQRPALTYIWLGLTVVAFSIAHWRELARQRELTESGRFLLQHSNASDRIFVWGQTPKIYLDAHRRPASRFVVTFPLTGYIFGGFTGIDTHNRIVPGAWTELEQDFNKHPPAYIVDVQVPQKNAQYPVGHFPFLARLLADKYRPVARTAEGVIYGMR